MTLNNKILVVAVGVAVLSTSLLLRDCSKPDPGKPGEDLLPVASTTPVTAPEELAKLPALPNNDKPVAAVKVPAPDPKPGMKVDSYVVAGASGNTYLANVETIDWGLRLEPKASAAASTDFLVGVDLTFFSWWRLNADALVYVPIRSDLDFTRSRAGLGVSFQVSPNTSAGVGYLRDLADRASLAAFVSLKF